MRLPASAVRTVVVLGAGLLLLVVVIASAPRVLKDTLAAPAPQARATACEERLPEGLVPRFCVNLPRAGVPIGEPGTSAAASCARGFAISLCDDLAVPRAGPIRDT